MIVIGKNDARLVGAEVHGRLYIALALPRERARGAWRQRAFAAQLVDVERKTGLDSALPCATMSTGTTPTHFTSPIFEII